MLREICKIDDGTWLDLKSGMKGMRRKDIELPFLNGIGGVNWCEKMMKPDRP